MVGGVRRVGNGSQVPTVKARAKKAYAKTQTALKVASLFSSIARHAAEVAEIFKELPDAAKIGLGASKFPSIINGFLSIQKAAEDVWEIIKEPGKARSLKRFEASCKLLVHLDSVTRAVANSLKFLKTVGAVGLRVVKWVPIFNIVSYIIGFVSLGLASYSVHKSRKLLVAFEAISRDFNEAKTDDAKALVLERAIDLVEQEGIESLRKELRLSKASKSALLERVGGIRMRRFAHEEKSVSDAQAIADMNEAFMILKDRLKVQLGYKCTNLANQVVEIVGETLSLTPAAPVGVGIVLATSVCSLVTFAGRTYFINKNPFDPRSESKAAHLLTNLKGGFEHVRQAIHVHRAVGRRLRPA